MALIDGDGIQLRSPIVHVHRHISIRTRSHWTLQDVRSESAQWLFCVHSFFRFACTLGSSIHHPRHTREGRKQLLTNSVQAWQAILTHESPENLQMALRTIARESIMITSSHAFHDSPCVRIQFNRSISSLSSPRSCPHRMPPIFFQISLGKMGLSTRSGVVRPPRLVR